MSNEDPTNSPTPSESNEEFALADLEELTGLNFMMSAESPGPFGLGTAPPSGCEGHASGDDPCPTPECTLECGCD